jgi:hypothetical protein
MALLGEASNVPPEGLAWILLTTLQVPVVAGSLIHALKISHEDLHGIPQLSIMFLGRWSNQALAELAR